MTDYAASGHEGWTWEDMLQEFCSLGGVVKNVVPTANGLFVRDPAEPVVIRVPARLLIQTQNVKLVADQFVLDEAAEVPEPVRSFFERYANTLGLRAASRTESAAFIGALSALPDRVRQILVNDFGLNNLLQDDVAAAVRSQILTSRQVVWKRTNTIAPVIELARYAPEGLKPERGMSLQIQGHASKEIFVRFVPNDSLSAFCLFGSAVPETVAFSLPTEVNAETSQVVIGRTPNQGKLRGKDRVPTIVIDSGKIALSYLLIGHRRSPALPRSVFRALLTEAGVQDPDKVFDIIVRSNTLKFINLLVALEPHQGEMIATLRKMARYQLEAIAHCISSRRLSPL